MYRWAFVLLKCNIKVLLLMITYHYKIAWLWLPSSCIFYKKKSLSRPLAKWFNIGLSIHLLNCIDAESISEVVQPFLLLFASFLSTAYTGFVGLRGQNMIQWSCSSLLICLSVILALNTTGDKVANEIISSQPHWYLSVTRFFLRINVVGGCQFLKWSTSAPPLC